MPTEEFVSPPADARSPDHSTYSYVHDETGFADCWLRVGGADRPGLRGPGIMVNPKLAVEPPEGKTTTMAEPVEWGAVQ